MNDFIVVELNEAADAATSAALFEGGQAQPLELAGLADGAVGRQVHVLLDGRAVVVHSIEMPNLDAQNALKILPGLLDEKLSVPVDGVHYALVGDHDADGGTRPVAVVQHALIDRALATVADLGIKADCIVPDFMVLPRAPDLPVLFHRENRSLVRMPDGSGFGLETDMIDLMLQDSASKDLSSKTWPELLADAPLEAINLLQGPYRPRTGMAATFLWWRRSAVLALAGLVVFAGSSFYQATRDFRQADALYIQAEQIFRQVLPEEGRIVNMGAQLRRALAAERQQGGSEFFILADAAFRAVEAGPETTIESMRYNREDGSLVLEVSFASFAEITEFRTVLEKDNMRVSEGSSRQEGSRVFSEIRLGRL